MKRTMTVALGAAVLAACGQNGADNGAQSNGPRIDATFAEFETTARAMGESDAGNDHMGDGPYIGDCELVLYQNGDSPEDGDRYQEIGRRSGYLFAAPPTVSCRRGQDGDAIICEMTSWEDTLQTLYFGMPDEAGNAERTYELVPAFTNQIVVTSEGIGCSRMPWTASQ